MDDDCVLVRRLRDGDEAAFAALVRAYHPSLVRLAFAVVGNQAIADEVVQDTWLGVVRGVERFEGRSTFKTWLFHILLNRARSAAGRERRSDPVPNDVLAGRFDAKTGHWSAPPTAWTDDVDERLTAADLAPRVKRLIAELPDTQRQVVLLHDVEGLPSSDIAALLGLSASNQRVLLHRARARVRAGLEREVATQ